MQSEATTREDLGRAFYAVERRYGDKGPSRE
jgi:hypothetical protein